MNYISRHEAAEKLGVTPQTISNFVDRKVLGSRMAGRQVQVNADDVQQLIDSMQEIRRDEDALDALRKDLREEQDRLKQQLIRTQRAMGDAQTMFGLFCRIVQKTIEQNKDCLYNRERQLAELLFKDPASPYLSFSQVAEDFCLTRERVRQIACKMLQRVEANMQERENERQGMTDKIRELEGIVGAERVAQRVMSDHRTSGWRDDVFEIRLVDCDISVRSLNCTKAADIETIGDLVSYQKRDLLKFRNFGNKSLSELDDLVVSLGLHWGMKLEELVNTLDYQNVPDTIYLNTGIPLPQEGNVTVDFSELSEVTWSQDPVGSTDIKYQRVKH